MDTQTQAQIYLADQRALTQTSDVRSYHYFNTETYVEASRYPFGALHRFNDTTLRAGASLTTVAEQFTHIILLPVAGGLAYQSEVGSGFLEPGQVQHLALSAGMRYTVSNPYETKFINLIDLWLVTEPDNSLPASSQTDFGLSHKNRLLPLFDLTARETNWQGSGFIGQYAGRQEDVYPLRPVEAGETDNGIFVFCLQGAFEVQSRLLHERDGLALISPVNHVVEFEALSPDALLVLLEFPVKNSHRPFIGPDDTSVAKTDC